MNRLLTFRRARTYAVLFVGLYVTAWIYELSSGSPPVYGDGVPIGGDYIAFHTAGRLLLQGRGPELYDRAAVIAVQDGLLAGRSPGFYDAFRNPPFAALPFVPLALLDLLPGFAVWSVLSLACLALSLRLLIDEVSVLKRRWRGLILCVFAFAPVYFGLIDGENATVSLLLYALIYRDLSRFRDERVAVWAALGLFKPQLFVVFPLLLVARRSWRALLVYCSTASLLVLISFALVGPAGMYAWLRILVEPESGQVLVNAWRMASLKSFFDTLLTGAPTVAIGLYLAASTVLLGALYALWARRRGSIRLVWILTSLVAALVDPHLVDYDLTVLVPAGVFAALYVPSVRWWLVPLFVVLVFRADVPVGGASLQLSTLILIVCLGLVWRRTRAHPFRRAWRAAEHRSLA